MRTVEPEFREEGRISKLEVGRHKLEGICDRQLNPHLSTRRPTPTGSAQWHLGSWTSFRLRIKRYGSVATPTRGHQQFHLFPGECRPFRIPDLVHASIQHADFAETRAVATQMISTSNGKPAPAREAEASSLKPPPFPPFVLFVRFVVQEPHLPQPRITPSSRILEWATPQSGTGFAARNAKRRKKTRPFAVQSSSAPPRLCAKQVPFRLKPDTRFSRRAPAASNLHKV